MQNEVCKYLHSCWVLALYHSTVFIKHFILEEEDLSPSLSLSIRSSFTFIRVIILYGTHNFFGS